jgi:osmotically inducible protein OsmC
MVRGPGATGRTKGNAKMALTNKASAHWTGDLKSGKGAISTGSGALAGLPYDFRKRFEGEAGTNPEELIGAAHAGCFAMAFSAELGKAGLTAEAIDTTATVTLDFIDGAPTVTKVHLDLAAKIPGASEAAFTKAANDAKAGCPISRLLKAEITLSAKLV